MSQGEETPWRNAMGQLQAQADGLGDLGDLDIKEPPNVRCFLHQSLIARMMPCSSWPGMVLVGACVLSEVIHRDPIHTERCPSLGNKSYSHLTSGFPASSHLLHVMGQGTSHSLGALKGGCLDPICYPQTHQASHAWPSSPVS